jgi:hypothetical protein
MFQQKDCSLNTALFSIQMFLQKDCGLNIALFSIQMFQQKDCGLNTALFSIQMFQQKDCGVWTQPYQWKLLDSEAKNSNTLIFKIETLVSYWSQTFYIFSQCFPGNGTKNQSVQFAIQKANYSVPAWSARIGQQRSGC